MKVWQSEKWNRWVEYFNGTLNAAGNHDPTNRYESRGLRSADWTRQEKKGAWWKSKKFEDEKGLRVCSGEGNLQNCIENMRIRKNANRLEKISRISDIQRGLDG